MPLSVVFQLAPQFLFELIVCPPFPFPSVHSANQSLTGVLPIDSCNANTCCFNFSPETTTNSNSGLVSCSNRLSKLAMRTNRTLNSSVTSQSSRTSSAGEQAVHQQKLFEHLLTSPGRGMAQITNGHAPSSWPVGCGPLCIPCERAIGMVFLGVP